MLRNLKHFTKITRNLTTNRPPIFVLNRVGLCRYNKENDPQKGLKIDSDESYLKLRMQDLEKHEKNVEPIYPHSWEINISLKEFREKFSHLNKGEKLDHDNNYIVAGRIESKRTASNKLFFYDIVAGDGSKLQVMASLGSYNPEKKDHFKLINNLLKRGDIIGIRGFPGKTGLGELSIIPNEIKLLAPCLHQLPHYYGLENPETRFRNRHLDFMINQHAKEIFYTRAKIIKFIRQFLDDRGFLEVETPILNKLSGGANAKPFETKLRALDMDLKLRIAPELFLKQLVIGGFDRVYEIGRVFRNEGIDSTHNPEFTSCELYQAFADYETVMKLTEDLLSGLAKHITGGLQVPILVDGKEHIIDFTPPYRRISYTEHLEEVLEMKLPNKEDEGAIKVLLDLCQKHHITVDHSLLSYHYLLDRLLSNLVEPTLIQPTFLCEHPIEISPLAKHHRSKPNVTERFELFIGGKEICNAYTELNDPRIQRQRFEDQVKKRKQGDEEAHEMDEHFCQSLEYGLPPTGGWGCGIDRLVMLFTESQHIRVSIFFSKKGN